MFWRPNTDLISFPSIQLSYGSSYSWDIIYHLQLKWCFHSHAASMCQADFHFHLHPACHFREKFQKAVERFFNHQCMHLTFACVPVVGVMSSRCFFLVNFLVSSLLSLKEMNLKSSTSITATWACAILIWKIALKFVVVVVKSACCACARKCKAKGKRPPQPCRSFVSVKGLTGTSYLQLSKGKSTAVLNP